MSARVSKAAIDMLKQRIDQRLIDLRKQVPVDFDNQASELAIKELGLATLAKQWAAYQAEIKKAKAKYREIEEKVRKVVNYNYLTERETLVETLNYNNPILYTQKRKEIRDRLVGELPVNVEIVRLERLRKDIDLTLELAGSSAEVKEALKNILAQIGE